MARFTPFEPMAGVAASAGITFYATAITGATNAALRAAALRIDDAQTLLTGVNTTQTGILRDSKGQWASFQNLAPEINRRWAKRYQDEVAAAEKQAVSRPAVSTGRLIRNIKSPKNITYDKWTFGVGVPDFLNSSSTKYWRQIEFGTAATMGSSWLKKMVDEEGVPLYGFWSTSWSGYHRNGWGNHPNVRPPYTRFRRGVSSQNLYVLPQKIRQSLQYTVTQKTYKYTRKSTGVEVIVPSRTRSYQPKIPRIAVHIKPHLAYKSAWEQGRQWEQEFEQAAIKAVLGKA